MNVPKLTHSDLEGVADKFFNDHPHGLFDGVSLRVESAIDRVKFTIMPVPGLYPTAEAFIPVRGRIIFLDEGIYRADTYRHRFTLAEELAHILIHLPLFEGLEVAQIVAARESITDVQYEQMELEAKYLAGALLMRRESFTKDFSNLVDGKPVGVEAHKFTIRRLSYFYNASIPSVAIRCVKLELISWAQYHEVMEALNVG